MMSVVPGNNGPSRAVTVTVTVAARDIRIQVSRARRKAAADNPVVGNPLAARVVPAAAPSVHAASVRAAVGELDNFQSSRRLGLMKVQTVPIHPGVRIGHVHLKVAELERALGFWHGVLGFEVMQRYGKQAVFLSAGGYHHHIGLNTWESAGGSPAPPGTTGLYHVAILYPTRALLADALRRLIAANIELDGAADHGVSEALYLRDPDGNGVELYWDRPPEQWPRDAQGELAMFTRALDLGALLKEQ